MRLQIFDVGHGFCALLTADNNNIILFDCGHDDDFRPSIHLLSVGCTAIQTMVITNFDHDHVGDLHNVRARLPIQVLHRNRSIPADTLTRIKLEGGPLSDALRSAIHIHRSYTSPILYPPDFAGVELRTYCNSYPTFTDTNNLSLVSFIFYDGIGILIPGDLERPGWLELLKDASFREDLQKTQIFVASHHGRESGYCTEVFGYCKPDIVVISDEAIQYDTQEHCYDNHACGLSWSDGTTRKVLSTRRDGHITVTKQAGQGYIVRTSTVSPPI
jgi:beta-lactamase superfamily II metal-dependent hydrolase